MEIKMIRRNDYMLDTRLNHIAAKCYYVACGSTEYFMKATRDELASVTMANFENFFIENLKKMEENN